MGVYFKESTDKNSSAVVRLVQNAKEGCVGSVVMLVLILVVNVFLKYQAVQNELILSIIIAGIMGGILQGFWFRYDTKTTASLNYITRILGFGLSYFAVLVGCAWYGTCLPVSQVGPWIAFTVLYLLILVINALAINSKFKKQGGTYMQQLEEYRKHQVK